MSIDMGPPCKKAKIEDAMLSSNIVDDYVHWMKETTHNLKAVLSNDFYRPLPHVKVYVGHVKDPKHLSKSINILNEKVPLKDLQHLKRARKKEILLCPVHFLNGMTSIQEYLEINVPELKEIFEYFKEIDVPAVPPKLKTQLANIAWSCNFHPNKYYEKLTSNNFFTKIEMEKHILHMEIAFEVAKWYFQQNNQDIMPDFFLKTNAAVVVDPLNESVVAVAFQNHDHPMKHATMVAVDNVAKTQNGGAWISEKDSGDPKGFDKDLLRHLMQKYPEVKFKARPFISKKEIGSNIENTKVAEEVTNIKSSQSCKDNEEEIIETPETIRTSESFSKSIEVFTETKDTHAQIDTDGNGPYLCTGYYIYLIKEPCVMCSMALVHARAKRVFFYFNNDQDGALNTRTKLQAVTSLNHHFEVFTGFY